MNKWKKNIFIFGLVALLILIVCLVWFYFAKNTGISDKNTINQSLQNLPTVEFLSTEEKASLGISQDYKIQALGRNEAGELIVYKIINSDEDIVPDPSSINPISPDSNEELVEDSGL